jgi:hypothetical protein
VVPTRTPDRGQRSASVLPDDCRVAVAARQRADALEIALDVDRRGVAADRDLHEAAARPAIAIHGTRAIPGIDQFLDEASGAGPIQERGDDDRIAAVRRGGGASYGHRGGEHGHRRFRLQRRQQGRVHRRRQHG